MRRVFGILFVILAVVCAPRILSPSIPETIGRILGWLLISVLPAYLLLRDRKKKDDRDEEESNNQ